MEIAELRKRMDRLMVTMNSIKYHISITEEYAKDTDEMIEALNKNLAVMEKELLKLNEEYKELTGVSHILGR